MPATDTLIHISAPTTKQGDNHFAAQATAYHDFRPVTTHNVMKRKRAPSKPQRSSQGPRIPSIGDALGSRRKPNLTSSPNRFQSSQDRGHSNSSLLRPPPDLSENAPKDSISIASAALNLRGLDTQHMFDTQYAVVGLQSQISGVLTDEDSPLPSFEFKTPSKGPRISDDDVFGSRERAKELLGALEVEASKEQPSSLVCGTQTSLQDRRDSQSAEVHSPVDIEHAGLPEKQDHVSMMEMGATKPEDISLVKCVEQEAARCRRSIQQNPDVCGDHGNTSDQPKLTISSLLPESYGLSRSDGSPKSATSKSEHVMETVGRKTKDGQRTLLRDQSIARAARPVATAVLEGQSNREVIWADPPYTAIPQCDMLPPKCDTALPIHTTKTHTLVTGTFSQSVLLAVDTRDFAKSQHEQALPIVAHTSSLAKQRQGQHEIMQTKFTSETTSSPTPPVSKGASKQWSANKIQVMNTDRQAFGHLEEIHQIPRQIFAKIQAVPLDRPSGDEITVNKLTGSSQPATALIDNSSHKLSPNSLGPRIDLAMAAERHMLYRRQMHRTLELIERGYWSFDISGWAPNLKLAFLQDLQTYVENGMFGKGSWVDLHFDTHRLVVKGDLYCGVAELGEAWLLLMVLSDRRLGESDMHWYGWDGKAALTMPGKPMRKVAGTVA